MNYCVAKLKVQRGSPFRIVRRRVTKKGRFFKSYAYELTTRDGYKAVRPGTFVVMSPFFETQLEARQRKWKLEGKR